MQVFDERLDDPPALPVLVSIPHAGTYVPRDVAANFASDYIRSLPMTDWHLAELYDFLPNLGIDSLYATCSRFVADLNRPPGRESLYPGRFETGLVALKTFDGRDVYIKPPGEDEIERRRLVFHAPYHARLRQLLDAKVTRFGQAVLVDAHSVASGPSLIHDALTEDVYLGDRDGRSCAPWLTELFAESFAAKGYAVVRNAPYKGGYTTDHYGGLPNVQAIQIEMCQRLYMDESDAEGGTAHPNFARMRAVLQAVFEDLVAAI